MIRRDENDRMHELWAATRPFAIWVYLGALAFPALLGGLWRLRQVRRHRGAPERELSRHELAYLHGGPREVVLAAVRRLRRTRALAVTNRGLVHAVEPRRRLPDRIDNTIVTNANFVFPKVFAKSLRRWLRPIVKRLEDDGLLVRNRDVRRRVGTVAVLQIGVSVAFLALVVVAGVLRELTVVELLFLACAVLVLVMTIRRYRPGVPEPTLRGEAHLVDAGLRPPAAVRPAPVPRVVHTVRRVPPVVGHGAGRRRPRRVGRGLARHRLGLGRRHGRRGWRRFRRFRRRGWRRRR